MIARISREGKSGTQEGAEMKEVVFGGPASGS
jgi:hypothetical protein